MSPSDAPEDRTEAAREHSAEATTDLRLYVADPLALGSEAAFSPDQLHRLRHVRRLAAGDRLRLFNGSDGEWLAAITRLDRSHATWRALRQTRAQVSGPQLCLMFVPLRREATEWLLEKASELGVTEIVPVLSERCNHRGAQAQRLNAILIGAAEQSERLDVPVLRAALPLADAIEAFAALEPAPLFVAAERIDAMPARAALPGSGRRAGILVGPEGGFTQAELDFVRGFPFVTCLSLGPRILRAETAAVALCALWQALAGDWG